MSHESQQHIDQQRRVNLPSHRIGAVAQEAAELEALLYLFEKHLDVPTAAIKITHGARTPSCVVGDEDHHPPRAVHFHPGLDAAQFHTLMPALQRDGLILEDVLIIRGVVLYSPVFHVVLGAGDPPDAALIQIEEVVERGCKDLSVKARTRHWSAALAADGA